MFLHVRSRHPFASFELARRVVDRLGPAVSVVDSTPGFRSFDRRDLHPPPLPRS